MAANVSNIASTCGLLNVNATSWNYSTGNGTECQYDGVFNVPLAVTDVIMVVVYGLICVIGLVGNGLVIFVITRYTKMKTVTNMYILNLSIADFIFLMGMPMIMSLLILRYWVYGEFLCKMYFMLTCINMFVGPYTLTVMSGDRFLAVCYPISSMKYRTPKYARIAIALIWVISFVVMLPVLLYANLVDSRYLPGKVSCKIEWPAKQEEAGQKIFSLYNLILGFAIPVFLIILLYTLLVVRLRTVGPQVVKSADKKRSRRKVTTLVTLIIAVFIVCWLPYWVFQLYVLYVEPEDLPKWVITLYSFFSLLSYSNSMVNPLLYAFTNENFREAFINSFHCVSDPILGMRRHSDLNSVANNNSMCTGRGGKRYDAVHQTELSVLPPKPSPKVTHL